MTQEITAQHLERIESLVGHGHKAWDCVEPHEIIAAVLQVLAPVCANQQTDADLQNLIAQAQSKALGTLAQYRYVLRAVASPQLKARTEVSDICLRSVAAALERAGVTECDDPGEAIDVLVADFRQRVAELEARAVNVPRELLKEIAEQAVMVSVVQNTSGVIGLGLLLMQIDELRALLATPPHGKDAQEK